MILCSQPDLNPMKYDLPSNSNSAYNHRKTSIFWGDIKLYISTIEYMINGIYDRSNIWSFDVHNNMVSTE